MVLYSYLYAYFPYRWISPRQGSHSARGMLFHRAVMHAKLIIWRDPSMSNTAVRDHVAMILQREFDVRQEVIENVCSVLLDYLTRNRQLINQQRNGTVFFESWIVSHRVRIGGGSFPLVGRVDEIDFTRKTIVERASFEEAQNPRLFIFKQVQAALYYHALLGVRRTLREWRRRAVTERWRRHLDAMLGLLNGSWEVYVETPTSRVRVDPDDPTLLNIALNGYRYVKEISYNQGLTRRGFFVFFERRMCSVTLDRDCPFFPCCVSRRLQFPLSRRSVRRGVRQMLRTMIHDIMWTWDRYLYAMSMFLDEIYERPRNFLDSTRYAEPYAIGQLRDVRGDEVIIEVEPDYEILLPRFSREVYLVPYPFLFTVGPRLLCNVRERRRREIVLTVTDRVYGIVRGREFTLSRGQQAFLSITGSTFLAQTPPISKRISEKRRRTLGRLGLVGTDDQTEYERRGGLRILDAMTGYSTASTSPANIRVSVYDIQRARQEVSEVLRRVVQGASRSI